MLAHAPPVALLVLDLVAWVQAALLLLPLLLKRCFMLSCHCWLGKTECALRWNFLTDATAMAGGAGAGGAGAGGSGSAGKLTCPTLLKNFKFRYRPTTAPFRNKYI